MAQPVHSFSFVHKTVTSILPHHTFSDNNSEYPMAFEQLKIEIAMLFEEMENQPEDKWKLHETLRGKLDELKTFGMPLPQDLVDLEKMLDEELASKNRG